MLPPAHRPIKAGGDKGRLIGVPAAIPHYLPVVLKLAHLLRRHDICKRRVLVSILWFKIWVGARILRFRGT